MFVGTAEWLIMSVVLALIFIVFVMQAYVIPTGSMADTLKGSHFRLRCRQCGYGYNYDFRPEYYRLAGNRMPGRDVQITPTPPRCPSCGYYQQDGQPSPVIGGDRIFVLKTIYQFTEPQRWDVVVFKNPLDPYENYIKRMIARPGETVEIIDGDIYIDGELAIKPKKVQDELWMVVYDNDYQPINPKAGSFNRHIWRQPFENERGSKWELDLAGATKFKLNSSTEKTHTIAYNTDIGNDFKATYAYDTIDSYPSMPICSDLMIRFYVQPGQDGNIGSALTKYETMYRGYISPTGNMVIEAIADGQISILTQKQIKNFNRSKTKEFRFANVDHQLILEFGPDKIIYDFGRYSDDMGPWRNDIMPQVKIFANGKCEISHIGIFRDIHYTARGIKRAYPGEPFTLGADEFFVCGDNSPFSLDARLWASPGKGNNGHQYRIGTVPRDYLVGKAFVVFWPGAFKVLDKVPIKLVPYLSGMKFIYGGMDQTWINNLH